MLVIAKSNQYGKSGVQRISEESVVTAGTWLLASVLCAAYQTVLWKLIVPSNYHRKSILKDK